MSAPVPVTCPRCGETAQLKNPALLGEERPCRACGEPFTLRADGRGIPKWLMGVGAAGAVLALLLCAGVFLTAFDQARRARDRADARAAANRAAAETPPPPADAVAPGRARALGVAFVAAAEAGDEDALARLIDLDALFDAATAGMEIPPDARRQMVAGFSGTAGGLAEQYAAAGRAGGVRLLGDDGAPGVDGPPGALIRLLPESGGLNYAVLYPTPDGRVGDMYVFASGERISGTLRRLFGPLLGGTEAEKDGAVRLGEMTAAARRGDAAAVERIYRTLPEVFKSSRGVQTVRAAAASSGDPEAYAEVLADIDRRFPADPTMDLLKLDFYAGDADKLVPTLARLDAAVGGDPYLRGLLAESLPDVGRGAEALELAEAAVAEEPGLFQAHAGLFATRLTAGDHAGAADVLRTFRDEFDLRFDPAELAGTDPRTAAFVESDAYAAFAEEG